jgi:hypothetical protein
MLGQNNSSNNNANRKKMLFLKNNDLDPVKIKLSELMSYKKLGGTSNNLAYCSSFRTFKDFFKENTDTLISIESKQGLS